ncbi:crotonobetainyl-CoA:carnitine CoA-transferase CaiB-like acyl-CoA transferase [Murinocardiopsis flavida]|uniref:Crotonobetainyl-CoA:carnitine CoA-transferase CaiB-like acyl-CoA transferase n=1 Tax=Murinocardiopsis flavida TaxID=645275 RepID=A0A2P8DGI0_9ACTN|nr:CoA transferase [Murinocardiopsis flavida]PSK96299.1 crotonobetainyl-CoA:carnitine CoA-transferase CaiB-like acyl-CoA transferase [Murinocardiopsis flavida]
MVRDADGEARYGSGDRPGGLRPGALDGITIVDFSRVLAGPLVTMVLADLGATVVKVERPGTGDDTRSWGPPHDPTGEATYFLSVNRNKTSAVLDLGTPEGVRRARELVAGADVLVENFRPGVMDRLGLGYADLHAAHPSLVYCSISAFGRGAGAALPGYDLLVQAVGGLMSVTGDPGGEPQKVGVALVDVIAGLYATVGILAALRHRERTGVGQRVEVELLMALLASLSNQAAAYTGAGVVPARMGNAHPSIAPYATYPTADGTLALAVGNDRQFAALVHSLGISELARDPRFATNGQRVAHRDELRALLEERFRDRGTAQWAAELTAAGVPSGPVNDIAAAFSLAQDLGLEPVVAIPRGDGAPDVRLPRNPITLSATPAHYPAPPPLFPGEDPADPAPEP